MVKVMPNRNSASVLPKVPRAAVAFVAAALVLAYASVTAHAAPKDAPADDWSIFSTYGITIIMVLVLIGLFVYKTVRPSKEAAAPAKSSGRTHRPEDTYLTPARTPPAETSALIALVW